MISDAISAGVAPGGLQSRTEIRVLICYLLHNSSVPLPLDRIKELLHFEGIANYFETTFAISDLEDNGNIGVVTEENGLKFYIATGDCKNIAEALGNSVPLTVRERTIEIAESVTARHNNERDNKVIKEKTENGIYITCSVMDGSRELVSVKLLVPDDESADTVKENFLKNPMQVLINATEGLTGSKI